MVHGLVHGEGQDFCVGFWWIETIFSLIVISMCGVKSEASSLLKFMDQVEPFDQLISLDV